MPRFAIAISIRAVYFILALANGVVIARYLGPEMFGVFSFALAIIALGCAFCQSGLPNLIVRELAYTNEQYGDMSRGEVISLSGYVSLACFILLSLALFFYGFLVGSSRQSLIIIFIGLPTCFFLPRSAIYQAATRAQNHPFLGVAAENIVRPISQFGLIILIIVFLPEFEVEPNIIMFVYLLSSGFCLLAAVIISNRYDIVKNSDFYTRVSRQGMSAFFTQYMFSSISSWSVILFQQIGVLQLGIMSSNQEVGLFRVAMQVALTVPIGLVVLNTLVGPRIAQAVARNETAKLQSILSSTCSVAAVAAFPVMLLSITVGKELLELLFGSAYSSASDTLIVLCVFQFAVCCLGSVVPITYGAGHERYTVLIDTIGLIVCIGCSYFLIPIYGSVGAAWGVGIGLLFSRLGFAFFLVYRVGIYPKPSFSALVNL